MNSNTLTVLGAILGAIAFAAANLPDDTPQWVSLVLGSLLAGGGTLLGYSHPGTKSKRDPAYWGTAEATEVTEPPRPIPHRPPKRAPRR